MRIMLQFPEGLKQKALEEAAKLESQGHEIFIASAPCFGACDLCLDDARNIGAKKIIHFGHAEFLRVKGKIEVEYRPYFMEIDWQEAGKAFDKAAKLLRDVNTASVALVYPVQHVENGKRAKVILERAGFDVKIAKGGAHVKYAGQVLGCDSAAAKVPSADAVVYFGGGKFHPTGILSDKPVLCIDPHLMDAYWITDEIKKAERKRNGSLLAASEAKTFGILISTKCGQINMNGARLAKKMLEKKGKRAVLLVANELNPLALANFVSFDAYINTACPRINEDTENFGKPIVNVADLKRLLELMCIP